MSSVPAQKEDANYLKKVREQYENYPYPIRHPEEEHTRILLPLTECFDRLNHFAYSGRRDFRKEFRALIAGGGTGDAAIALAEQLRRTSNEVTYIDMSETSMKVAQERAKTRGLTNIRWIHDSLLNIPKLDLGKFDYINCSGVLHHLADPDLGLRTLSDALKDDGAMGIMLYAKYGRMAVYMMQDLLRMINRDEPNLQKQVDNAKAILNNLPITNWLFNSSEMLFQELRSGDVGIYDLLLHTQDRAYSIPELYEYMRKAGLDILHFFSDHQHMSRQIYDPAFYLQDERLIQSVKTKPIERQRELAELLYSKIEKHTIYVAKSQTALPSVTDLDMIPVLAFSTASDHGSILDTLLNNGAAIVFNQHTTGTQVIVPNGPQLAAIWMQADGKKTLREMYQAVMDKIEGVTLDMLAMQFKPFYEALHRVDWLYLRHKSSMPIAYENEMQARMKPKGSAA